MCIDYHYHVQYNRRHCLAQVLQKRRLCQHIEILLTPSYVFPTPLSTNQESSSTAIEFYRASKATSLLISTVRHSFAGQKFAPAYNTVASTDNNFSNSLLSRMIGITGSFRYLFWRNIHERFRCFEFI